MTPKPAAGGDASPAGQVRLIPGTFARSDSGNAERFATRYKNELHYVSRRKQWISWVGDRWAWDESHVSELRTKDIARAIWLESRATPDMKLREALEDWAIKSEGASKRDACLRLARAEPGVTIMLEVLDADPWLLNCANGTLDLRTCQLSAHRREDMITKSTGTNYNPFALTGLWEQVLHNMTGGDTELAEYLQRVAGYSLTGMATERKFFFLYGPPGSGKSTFIEALLSCMGTYATSTPFDTWLERQQVGGNRDDLVELQGVRLVTSGEVGASKHWDTATVKKITGGDRITASAKFEKQVSFLPTCTLIFAANDSPKARDDDGGFWERMQRVPITNVVPIKDRIKDLHAVLRQPENAEAILAWAVDGCRKWQESGVGTSRVVTESSAEYRDDNDWISGFLEMYEIAEPCSVTAKAFRQQYEDYCKQEGQKPEATKTLARRIGKRTGGAVRYTATRGVRLWRGLRLIGDEPAQGELPVTRAAVRREPEQMAFTTDPDDLEPPSGRFDDD